MQFTPSRAHAAHALVTRHMVATPQYAWPQLAARTGAAGLGSKHENHTATRRLQNSACAGAITPSSTGSGREHPEARRGHLALFATRGNHGQGQARGRGPVAAGA